MDRHPVRSRKADWSQPKKPGRCTNGSGSAISSPRSPRASCRWSPPRPRDPRTESARMASPKKVMASTTPAPNVSTTKASPRTASGVPIVRNQNSDQVRFANGSCQMMRASSLGRSPAFSETTAAISFTNARIRCVQRLEENGKEEHDPHEGGDRAGRVAEEDAKGQTEHTQECQIGPRHEERTEHPGVSQGRHRRIPRQDEPSREEAGKGQDLAHDHGDGGDHHDLGPEEHTSPGYGRQGGADGPAAVLAGDHQDAEQANGERTDGEPGQGLIGRVEALLDGPSVVMDVGGGENRDEQRADHGG